MKILEICPFSAGICGVWQRVKQESLELSKKGHDVRIVSSRIKKGSNEVVQNEDNLEKIKIKRIGKTNSILSKNVIPFDPSYEIRKFDPDIVITHLIHPHSFKALKMCNKLKIPCYLVSHAPFGVKRSFPLNLATKLYYLLVVKSHINKFNKIIAITKWEISYLLKLGAKEKNIVYIPNGIPEGFFKESIKKFKAKKIIFFGRIAPVKNLEVLISVFNKLNNKKLNLEIIGPIERGYERIKNFESDNIKFLEPIHDLKEKIQKLQEVDIFILPSRREAMPQSLIEAMALGKLVIASKTQGAIEIINDNKNGLLFKVGNEKELLKKISWALDKKNFKNIEKIQKQARKKSKEFRWKKLTKSWEEILK